MNVTSSNNLTAWDDAVMHYNPVKKYSFVNENQANQTLTTINFGGSSLYWQMNFPQAY